MLEIRTLFSSSDGNCTLVCSADGYVLIDAGGSAKAINDSLRAVGKDPAKIRAIFVTHEHTDHTKGLAGICKNGNFPIYMSAGTESGIDPKTLEKIGDRIAVIQSGDFVTEAGMEFCAFRTPHDVPESLGYTVSEKGRGKVFGYATDIGHITELVRSSLLGCSAVVLESNHEINMLMMGRYPDCLKRRIRSDFGHLSNDCCGDFIKELVQSGTKSILLAHLSKENNLPELAFENAKQSAGEGIFVAVAPVKAPSEVIYA